MHRIYLAHNNRIILCYNNNNNNNNHHNNTTMIMNIIFYELTMNSNKLYGYNKNLNKSN